MNERDYNGPGVLAHETEVGEDEGRCWKSRGASHVYVLGNMCWLIARVAASISHHNPS